MFDKDGNPMLTSGPEFFGNTIVVNGKAWTKLGVCRAYSMKPKMTSVYLTAITI
jgi:hypothetical protein